MRRALRAVLVLFLLLAALIAAAPLLTPVWAGPVARRVIAPKLEKKLGRKVEVGSAGGGIGRLDVHDLVVHDPPAFGGGPGLKVQKAELRFQVGPLYRGQLYISAVRLTGVDLHVRSNADADTLTPIWKKLSRRRRPPDADRRIHVLPDASIELHGKARLTSDRGTRIDAGQVHFTTLPGHRYHIVLDRLNVVRSDVLDAGLERIAVTLAPDRRIPFEHLEVKGPRAELQKRKLLEALVQRFGMDAIKRRLRRFWPGGKRQAADDDDDDN